MCACGGGCPSCRSQRRPVLGLVPPRCTCTPVPLTTGLVAHKWVCNLVQRKPLPHPDPALPSWRAAAENA